MGLLIKCNYMEDDSYHSYPYHLYNTESTFHLARPSLSQTVLFIPYCHMQKKSFGPKYPITLKSENNFPNKEEFDFRVIEKKPPCTIQAMSASEEDNYNQAKDRMEVGRQEPVAISAVRILVVVSLCLLGAFSSITTFRYIDDENGSNEHGQQIQEDRYGEYVDRVFECVEKKLSLQLAVMDSLSSDFLSYSRNSESVWPEVTIPDFEMLGSKARSIADVNFIGLLPLVTKKEGWESYSVANQDWHQESLDYLKETTGEEPLVSELSIKDTIWDSSEGKELRGPYLPLWQSSPVVADKSVYNFNVLSNPITEDASRSVLFTGGSFLGGVITSSEAPGSELQRLTGGSSDTPQGTMFYPILDDYVTDKAKVVGSLFVVFSWESAIGDVIPSGNKGAINCVLENADGQEHTFLIDEHGVAYQGSGDLHNTKFSSYELKKEVVEVVAAAERIDTSPPLSDNSLKYTMKIYPANSVLLSGSDKQALEGTGSSKNAAGFTSLSVVAFLSVIALFFAYDCLVKNQYEELGYENYDEESPKSLADKSFVENPQQISARSDEVEYPEEESATDKQAKEDSVHIQVPAAKRLNTFLKDETERAAEEETSDALENAPIADFFPNCTVLFAEIVGFTAWSSQHEPTQVFSLLQELYQAFDKEAKKRGVFKVESIGDSYIAVAGLPDPQDDHAVRMATFCLECRKITKSVTRKLERSLGPETGDLGMRFGIHSGPVTAGVLQGERSRFQLFGDTVNTAARMGSSGHKGLIQASEATALLLIEADRGSWVARREETTTVVGKGEMMTYWVDESEKVEKLEAAMAARRSTLSLLSSTLASSLSLSVDDSFYEAEDKKMKETPRRMLKKSRSRVWGKSEVDVMPNSPRRTMKKRHASNDLTKRLIDWNVDILLGLLKQIAVKRVNEPENTVTFDGKDLALRDNVEKGRTVVDEVAEIIPMPTFDAAAREQPPSVAEMDVGSEVEKQLRTYISSVASMYRDNPFHNYEHACHVQMAMLKLLQRVVSPNDINYDGSSSDVLSDAHKYTYGITSDPLTSFAVVFCALIHDVDHTGVTNGQLIKEGAHIAAVYKNKSIAEQNSIDLAWELLMGDEYKELRSCIYSTMDEFRRFRQLVVNVVLATDIFDKELSALRKNRWTKAFTDYTLEESELDYVNRKATIVIEHLIQASDVSHTMQHWDIYRKWNQKLFYEMYLSYTSGRTDSSPADGWYKGELWFFDNYVIPLAKKLKDCGVFGVSSDECLNYAIENRKMWKIHGEKIVEEMKSTDYFATLKARRSSTGKNSRSPKSVLKEASQKEV